MEAQRLQGEPSRGSFFLSWVALCALASIGCTPAAINLRPREVAGDQAAIFGRVLIVNEGKPITSDCKIVFTDEDQQGKTPVLGLDKTGWVFTTVRPGPTYLSLVTCSLAGAPSGKVEYSTERLAFQAPGSGRIVYFGAVRIDMQTATLDAAARMTGAVMSRALTGSNGTDLELARRIAAQAAVSAEPGKPHATSAPMPGADVFAAVVENQLDEAVFEYQIRYGEDAQMLKPEASIAGSSAGSIGALADQAPPELALGFALGRDPAAAETVCTTAGLTWQKLEGGGFSCSGAAVDLGVPVTVKISACTGMICEVVADAGADGAPWSTLLQRFGKLGRRLAREHGSKHQRETRPLAGCSQGADCATAGRIAKSETWRWPNKQQVSLVLDGGPPGGAPSLRIVYRTGLAREGKP